MIFVCFSHPSGSVQLCILGLVQLIFCLPTWYDNHNGRSRGLESIENISCHQIIKNKGHALCVLVSVLREREKEKEKRATATGQINLSFSNSKYYTGRESRIPNNKVCTRRENDSGNPRTYFRTRMHNPVMQVSVNTGVQVRLGWAGERDHSHLVDGTLCKLPHKRTLASAWKHTSHDSPIR